MAEKRRIGVDLANVFDKEGEIIATLAWGDEVEVVEETDQGLHIRLDRMIDDGGSISLGQVDAFIKRPAKASGLQVSDVATSKAKTGKVMRVDFVDVQQGDGSVIETPGGKVVLIDGGDNQLFARYLAARFRGSSDERPREVDCILVSHGDADHFAGLSEIRKSESHKDPKKRLFLHPRRVYHNGLVKRPEKIDGKEVREEQLLGSAEKGEKGELVITGLVEDPREVPPPEMNKFFRDWAEALDSWEKRGPIEVRRLSLGEDDAFDFLAEEDIRVEVLGPIVTQAGGREGLRFLGEPSPRVERQPGQSQVTFSGHSASHTINGHSVILRITYGRFRFLFAGDLNEEAEGALTDMHQAGTLDLMAEVFKVPHHGSADFAAPFLEAVSPVMSVISAGDESARKEFIHPRANLLGALSRKGRPEVDEPLIFVTELAAFFALEGPATVAAGGDKPERRIFAFSRRTFGIVKVRTDGERLLIYTYSGKQDLKEAYAFRWEGDRVVPDGVRKC